MGDEQQRAVPTREGHLELLDGWKVQMIGRLVEHEAIGAVGDEQSQLRSRAFARRERSERTVDLTGAEGELGEQRACFTGFKSTRIEKAGKERFARVKAPPGLAELAEHDPRTDPSLAVIEWHRPEDHREQRRLASPVSPEDPQAVAPSDLEVDRPEVPAATSDHSALEPHHDVTASGRSRHLEMEQPGFEGLLHLSEAFEGAFGRADL